MEINVSEVSLNDKKGWESLYRQYAAFYQMPMTQETLDKVWSWIEDEQEAFYCIVARNENAETIGLMHFRAMASPLRGTKAGFLDDLFVVPEYRGTGVVEKLFNSLQHKAQSYHWPFVRWITAADNLRAQAAYDRMSERTKWVTYQLNVSDLV